MVHCVLVGCSHRSPRGTKKGITFHRFPLKDQRRLSICVANIKRENMPPLKNAIICSALVFRGQWLELSMEYSFQNGEVRRLLPSTSLDGHPGQVIVHPQPPPSGIRHWQSGLSNRQLFWHRQLCTSIRRHFWHWQSYRSIRRYFWLTCNRLFLTAVLALLCRWSIGNCLPRDSALAPSTVVI